MFLNRFVFTCFFILFSSFLTAQTQKELEMMSYKQLRDSVNNNKLNKKRIVYFAKQYLKKAKREKNIEEIATGYYYHTYFSDDKTYYIYCDSIINLTKNRKSDKYPMLAYTRKSVKDVENSNYSDAVENLLLSEKAALKYNNLDFFYDTKNNIGIIKSEYLGDYREALNLYIESYNYFDKKKNTGENYREYNLSIIFGIADAYFSLNKTDSASYYNKIGYYESTKYKYDEMKYLFVVNEGANKLHEKKYQATIDSIDIALPKLKKYKNIDLNILSCYFYYGEAYKGLNNYSKALENYRKVDSIYQKLNKITPEFTDGYRFLIDYYKKTGNKEKQLYYINTLMSIDSSFQKNYKLLNRKIHKDYDIPHLVQEKESIINTLQEDKKVNYGIIGLLVLGFLSTVAFGIKQVQQKKKFKQLFDQLLTTNSAAVERLIVLDNTLKESKKTLDIAAEIVLDIKTKLKNFEKEKRYLNAAISVQSLAQDFNTNTKYLSGIINHTFQKSFTHYINDLRIDHIVQELKTNKNLRKYTISGIAEEAGFNAGESFSKAFFKRTGIKPSYFIKEINKI